MGSFRMITPDTRSGLSLHWAVPSSSFLQGDDWLQTLLEGRRVSLGPRSSSVSPRRFSCPTVGPGPPQNIG
jgi:hypothetical protein